MPDPHNRIAIVTGAGSGIGMHIATRLAQEGDATLLDRTTIIVTANLGNASNHSTKDLPLLVIGGRFKHGQHLAFDTEKNYPLPNLFVSMLQRMGIEADKFATSTGTLADLPASFTTSSARPWPRGETSPDAETSATFASTA